MLNRFLSSPKATDLSPVSDWNNGPVFGGTWAARLWARGQIGSELSLPQPAQSASFWRGIPPEDPCHLPWGSQADL